jgi:ketosteroid isomerase-like protein
MKYIAVIPLLLFVVACRQEKLSKTEMRNVLHQQNEKLGEYFKAGHAAQIATMYSDSAKLCPNRNTEVYIGRDAIKKFWAEASSDGSKLQEMTTETLTVDGDINVIYETGITTTKTLYKDSVYTSKVKFANVWKRQPDGNYLLDVDIWNAVKE